MTFYRFFSIVIFLAAAITFYLLGIRTSHFENFPVASWATAGTLLAVGCMTMSVAFRYNKQNEAIPMSLCIAIAIALAGIAYFVTTQADQTNLFVQKDVMKIAWGAVVIVGLALIGDSLVEQKKQPTTA